MTLNVCLLWISNLRSWGSIMDAMRVSLFCDLAREVCDRRDALLGVGEGGMFVALAGCCEGLLVSLSAAAPAAAVVGVSVGGACVGCCVFCFLFWELLAGVWGLGDGDGLSLSILSILVARAVSVSARGLIASVTCSWNALFCCASGAFSLR